MSGDKKREGETETEIEGTWKGRQVRGEGRDRLSRFDRGVLWEEERGGALNDPI